MEADWQEINRIPFPPETLQHGHHQGPTANLVACCEFDTQQELIWTGNELGRVTSFYGADLQKYTSYRGNAKEEGSVRQILVCDKGVLTVGSGSVHLAHRRGLPVWHLTRDEFHDLRCITFTGRTKSDVLVAGCQPNMFRIDIDKGEVVETIPAHSQYTMMKRSAHFICAATVDGWVHLVDPNSFQIKKSWHAHQAFFTDIDVNANFLVTCGCSQRQQIGSIPDPLVKVFDLKTMMPLPPVTFHGGAAFVRLHPRMQTTCIIASQSGQIQVSDIMSGSMVNIRQLNLMSSFLTHLEMAPSGEAMILNDSLGQIQLWGSPSRTRFHDLPTATEFADSSPVASQILDWNGGQPFGTIGLPYYKEVLFSAWPNYLVSDIGAPPPKMDPAFLASLTRADNLLYGPNPRKTRRNQFQNTREAEKIMAGLAGPKFLSEQAKEATHHDNESGRRISDALDSLGSMSLDSNNKDEVPFMYRPVEIKYSKFGVEDFDFEYFNKTKFSGLETHIVNSYANPLLQLFRFIPCVRNLALAHTASSCLYEHCLLCELGFLFDMLEKGNGMNCQASNFLKTYSSLPETASLGLLEDGIPSRSLPTVIQSACRFIIHRAKDDYKRMTSQHSQHNLMETAFVTRAMAMIRCASCNSDLVRPAQTLLHELAYPPRTPNKHVRSHGPTFSQILKASVERHDQSRGWCDRCKRYQQLHGRKTVQAIPPVLMINTAIRSADAKQLWARRGWLPKEIGIIVDNGQFFCYEGQDLRMHLARKMFKIQVYELIGVVADIQSDSAQGSHLVSMINVSPSSREKTNENNWHLFNDFLVRRMNDDDALRFDQHWKLPAVVAYQMKEYRHVIDDTWKDALDTSLLYRRWSVRLDPIKEARRCYTNNRNRQGEDTSLFRPLNAAVERPTPGFPIGIDAEFVKLASEEIELRADGSRHVLRPAQYGLARVSVLRGKRQGLPNNDPSKAPSDEYIPFIDDYIHITEPIIDYLTEFSGIYPGDLDPATSPHASTGRLVSRKIAYKKVWLLLNLGCLFVGHGLPKDFRTINIHVPKAQVVDTVNLFFDPKSLRRLSLKFLSWLLLNEVIQSDESNDSVQLPDTDNTKRKGHDSIIDACMALRLWEKWKELEAEGRTAEVIEEIYRRGRNMNFQVPRQFKTSTPSRISSSSAINLMAESGKLGNGVGSAPGTPGSKAAVLRAP